MRGVEKTGRTIEEAVGLALAELGARREEVEVEVLEEPNKGFLGIVGSKPARVRVSPKEDGITKARNFLEGILRRLNLNAQIDMALENGYTKLDVRGKHLGKLIGKRGQTLEAIQHLVNLVASKQTRRFKGFLESEDVHLVVDVGDYRKRREESLRRLALRMADKVRREGRSAMLEPMNAAERRVIHTALQGNAYVNSHSEGEEPYRRVIISPRRGGSQKPL